MDQEVYLKNVTQIGTPGPSGKIYIADDAYERVHMDDYRDVRVFVLMGHTECSAGKYTTFIEAAISVEDISFIRNIPVWTNKVWNRVYMEIKRAYDNMIIVGWAMDQKGISPVVTHEMESIHMEHFGSANQVLLLLDSEQQDECFYLSRNNHLYPKDGFYIYYSCKKVKEKQSEVEIEIPPETKLAAGYRSRFRNRREAVITGRFDKKEAANSAEHNKHKANSRGETDIIRRDDLTDEGPEAGNGNYRPANTGDGNYGPADTGGRNYRSADTDDRNYRAANTGGRHYEADDSGSGARGQYRAMLAAQQKSRSRRNQSGKFNAAAAVVTVALVAGIVVTGIRKDPDRAAQLDAWIETISDAVRGSADGGEGAAESEHIIYFTTEETGASGSTEDGENSTVTEDGENSAVTDDGENSTAAGDGDGSDDTSESTQGESAGDSADTGDSQDNTEVQQTSGDVIPVEEVDGGI